MDIHNAAGVATPISLIILNYGDTDTTLTVTVTVPVGVPQPTWYVLAKPSDDQDGTADAPVYSPAPPVGAATYNRTVPHGSAIGIIGTNCTVTFTNTAPATIVAIPFSGKNPPPPPPPPKNYSAPVKGWESRWNGLLAAGADTEPFKVTISPP